MKKRILIIPSCAEGNGTGHLKRMLDLYGSLSQTCDVSVYLPCSNPETGFVSMAEKTVPDGSLYAGEFPLNGDWDFIVVDKRKTGPEEFALWAGKGILTGIDEGGSMRNSFPYLVDTLPSLEGITPPNLFCPGFLDLPPQKYRKKPGYIPPERGFGRILVSFGGEDPGNLTRIILEYLLDELNTDPGNITVVEGPLFGDRLSSMFRERKLPEEVSLLKSPENLKELLFMYDTVFTSFGLTAYEAAAAGSRVILLNPSSYHSRLSKAGGFTEAGTGGIKKGKLRRLFDNPRLIRSPEMKGDGCKEESLSAFIRSLGVPDRTVCPVCGGRSSASAERFSRRTFFECASCGIEYLVPFEEKVDSYREEYFFSDYEKQYGRTYLDDFPVIRRMAVQRLSVISRLKGGGTILDVGCAYGPFLLEARNAGYVPSGLELVREAADYVRNKLEIPVICSPFEEAIIEDEYDILTMWYVIEHFSDLDRVLKKVNKIVKPGGIFAFSTPNSSGITGKSRRRRFFSGSPDDHYTVWNPSSASAVLSLYGFEIKKIRSTGHHPERFPGILRAEKGLKRVIVQAVSRIFGLGDTFEVYAVKTRSIFNDS